jgi:tRNA pseudouridine55 synthase
MDNDFNGLLVLDKPTGITSRAAVDRAETWFPRKTRIGHTGTLDPLATGVLVLCIGAATRLTEYVQRTGKIYRAGILLGATSDSDDADGTITPTANAAVPERAKLERELSAFVGNIEQVPPAYSAAKVAGRRAYSLARKGKEVSLAPRIVRIDRIDILDYSYPRLEIVVGCGKGTYIRSLARDLGRALGCGGYIASLRRLAIGTFTEADAILIDADAAAARAHLLPTWRAVQDHPPIRLADEDLTKLRQGQRIAMPHSVDNDSREVAVADNLGRMVAVVEVVDQWAQPIKVLLGPSEPDA